MTFKIAMTLSAIRTDKNDIVCSDVDFEAALTLVSEVYMNHVLTILSEIDKPKHQFSDYEKAVLDSITQNEISRSSILSSVKKVGIKDRTLSDYLNKFTRLGLVQKVKRGVYKRR
jgi:predicted AAA+ superfamily ATPase